MHICLLLLHFIDFLDRDHIHKIEVDKKEGESEGEKKRERSRRQGKRV